MKQGLSKREKILLFFAGLLIFIYVAVQFAIYPLITAYTEGVRERTALSAEKRMVEADIANISFIRNANNEANENFDRIKHDYPLLIPNEEIDPLLTNLCLDNNLRPSSLRFVGTAGVPQSENGDTGEPTFTLVSVSMNVTGSFNSILRLLEKVDSIRYIRITTLSYSANRLTDTPDAGSITLSFELTYVNP